MLRSIFLGLFAAVTAGILFVNIYNSVVDAPNWGARLPGSMTNAREYFSAANPGSFFRVISPVNQALALIAVIVCWRYRPQRYLALTALALAVLTDVLTFGYFYPRNEIMFVAPLDTDVVKVAWNQWSTMNWFRSALCGITTVLGFVLFSTESKKRAS